MRKLLLIAGGFYAVLVVASNVVRLVDEPVARVFEDRQTVELDARRGFMSAPGRTTLAWRSWGDPRTDTLPVILLHGSPGSANDFVTLGPLLAQDRLVLAPDMPGFGASSLEAPDYSVESHAAYVSQWLSELDIDRAHLLGFSMGGGVALSLVGAESEQVASITMVAAIGVQELELLGNYTLNHFLHGAQIWLLRGLKLLTPHFGAFDRTPLTYQYARNFYDTDQRPLRGVLQTLEQPFLIVHGEHDPLVPKQAALEHHRLVPQSELIMLDRSHFFVFRNADIVSDEILDFLRRVDDGTATRRSEAPRDRVRGAASDFDPKMIPAWTGPALLSVLVLLALATLISEDLTLIGAGLLVAQGRIGFPAAFVACYVGIVGGDLLLFLAGRTLGRRVLEHRLFKWWVSEESIEKSSEWLRRRGAIVILVTRVLPGTRLPTNVAAGLLRTSALAFLVYFALAGLFWTPSIIWGSAKLGEQLLPMLEGLRYQALTAVVLLALVMWLVHRVVVPLFTWRGRRKMIGRWRRRLRWEFWPSWAIYPPVVLSILRRGLAARRLTLFTSVNPCMPAGGFVGESKADTLRLPAPRWLPKWREIGPGELKERCEQVVGFIEAENLSYPIVLKPDAGQRGEGVAIIQNADEIEPYLSWQTSAVIAQEYIGGLEYGIFWSRHLTTADSGRVDDSGQGVVFSITVKRSPVVTGDGAKTLEHLILEDPRAHLLAVTYLRENPGAEKRVPAAGEDVPLVLVGAHSRGTVFTEGGHLHSEQLERTFDTICASIEGFDFGRLDVRVPSEEALATGERLKILEINGITSEPTNMYDARYSLRDAVRMLTDQWRRAFEIGAWRREQGREPVGALELWRMWRDFRKRYPVRR